MAKRYTIYSDNLRKNFTNRKLTFSIERMRADKLLMVRAAIQYLDTEGDLIVGAPSRWWVVGKTYQQYYYSINLPEDMLNQTAFYRVILQVDELSNENKLYFNHVQLAEGSTHTYHQPNSAIPKTEIKFSSNFYANLYNADDDNYLQVIRPYYNNMDTETITKSKVTVLAPHLANEDAIDSPANLGLEFMNQTDQVIEILR